MAVLILLAGCSADPTPAPTVTTAPTATGPPATVPSGMPTPTPAATPTPSPAPAVGPGTAVTQTPTATGAPSAAPTPTAAPALPDIDTEKVFHDYFDVATGAGPGTEVIGRINLERNRNVARSPIPDGYTFSVVEDDSGGMFDLHTERDRGGRLFGVFRVAEGQTARTGSYSLRVELRQGPTVMARFTAPVSVAPRTQWNIYYDRAIEFVGKHGRLTGRRNYNDAEVAALIAELEANDGAFEGMRFYSATTVVEWEAIGARVLGNELQEAANRIGGLGRAYAEDRRFGPSGQEADRDRLRNAVYLALIAYVDHFPLDDFANSGALPYGDRTHQWLYSDPISGAAVLIYRDLLADVHRGVQRASDTRERLFRLLQYVNFDLPEGWRMPSDVRYYLPGQLAESSGAWADGNRHHRMRSWAAMPVIWYDYNRPLTELPWWYGDYEPFASENTSILPEWEPSGSFADLRVWLETNARYAARYGQSGISPDGSISHHVGRRQDLAFAAYGFPWMTGTTFEAASLLAGTRWEVSDATYDEAADFLLFAYPRLIYKDSIDFQATGRGHYQENAASYGSGNLADGIETILDAQGAGTVMAREAELAALRAAMVNNTHEQSGTIAFWVNDYLVHRRGGAGETPWYASVKMQSARTRGAESFSNNQGFHNGSGVLLIKVDGDEYNDSRHRWDWHALPGITEELRTDRIPKQSDANEFNPNHLAGVASNERYGLAAFQYASDNTYASAAANKGYFFTERYVLALGNDVRRVRNTDRSNGESIITTLDQAAWNTNITYRLNGASEDSVVRKGADVDDSFRVTGNSWFHQDRTGYVILPAGNIDVMLRGGNSVVDSNPGDTGPDVFHLAIDHGRDPDGTGPDGEYAYLLVPNVSASRMPAVVDRIEERFEIVNTAAVQGHRYADDSAVLVQLAFYEAGAITFGDGMTVAVDKPALVQLQKTSEGWNVTVQDPMHHADESAIAASREFQHILLPGPNRITVEVNLPLRAGTYTYETQGPDVRFVDGQTVRVVNSGDTSTLTFELPDSLDAVAYDYRQELYAGMPAAVHVPSG
ncbi:MAG: polysaccharide lyase beta-sandwich domain-containing protein [Chloroflexi bacterium]|nr:polysaccharide lyase beta-sandwich domain-containing protein [Chloroflexota bacterium]